MLEVPETAEECMLPASQSEKLLAACVPDPLELLLTLSLLPCGLLSLALLPWPPKGGAEVK